MQVSPEIPAGMADRVTSESPLALTVLDTRLFSWAAWELSGQDDRVMPSERVMQEQAFPVSLVDFKTLA